MRKYLLVLFVLLIIISPVFTQNRTALVIGNGAYSHFPVLTSPRGEAISMNDALQRIGFEVILVLDGSEDDILDALGEFEDKLKRNGGLAFFHYGGHGVQVDGRNYIIPVNADIPDERRVRSRAVEVDEIIGAMDASGSKTNIIILDACRDNPLPGGSRSGTRGLSVVERQPPDSIVVYSAAAGSTAKDGVFTPILLKYIETPGLEFTEMLRKVRTDVREITGGSQRTGNYDQLESEVFLAGPEVGIRSTPIALDSKKSSSASASSGTVGPMDDFVLVSGGTFQIGSTSGRSTEKPVHRVTVSSFYMSKYEVTQAEYMAVMGKNPSDTEYGIGDNYPVNKVSWYDAVEYCNKLSRKEGLTPVYSGSGDNISMNKNANGYRLPTEAEWEYAARGGSSGLGYTYSGSNSIESVAWYNSNSGDNNHPVGEKQSNELGLYDMSGNVWEWCWDWYGSYSSGSQTDPAGNSQGLFRVGRGGGWDDDISNSRSSFRSSGPPKGRADDLGFRIVRDN